MKGAQPWFAGEADGATKRHAPATLRNRDAIAEVLRRELPEDGLVLEIASGSGEHAIYFAEQFPRHIWQPSDPDPVALASISVWMAEAARPNALPPLELDAASPHWPLERAGAILCINMAHISPWAATLGLLEGATRLLDKDAPLILYGPFLKSDIETAPSNLAFDQQLRSRDRAFGIRSVEDIDLAARERGIVRMALYPMPANNMMLVYRRS